MSFRILELPVEIRLQILHHMLTHTTPILTNSAQYLGPPRPTSLNLSPAILCTSHRLYAEGLPILYSRNLYQVHPQILTKSIFALDPRRLVSAPHCIALIKRLHIRVRLDCDQYYGPETVAKVFSGMDHIEVEVFRASWGIGGYGALEGFRDVRGVKRAKVHGSVGRKFARWLEGSMECREGEYVESWEEDFVWEQGFVGRYDDR